MSLPLSIQDLHKTYAGSEHPVFDGFSLEVEAGALCAVMGPSGVGKTTLLNCIAGLDHWEGGSIRVGGAALAPSDRTAMSLHRRANIGLAFQQPHLLPEFTLEENLALPLMLDGGPDASQKAWIRDLLTVVGLADLVERFPNQLSGGQAARGGLARALVRRPALWLLDEPTGNLDPQTAEEVFGFLLRLHDELKPTTLLVTHNPELAARCGRIVHLS
ncbi:MAG TPA: ABC transporter ATP-binding protein [Holophagaceae bacterium]|jgi:putative ABC transport system ATP-binding protein|nr:ABC transporter ATP-binding protein [Holophagaceae bacterium]